MIAFYYLYFISILTTIVGLGIVGIGYELISRLLTSNLSIILTLLATFIVVFTALSSLYFEIFEMMYGYLKVKYSRFENRIKHRFILSLLMTGHMIAVFVLMKKEIWIGIVVLLFAFEYVIKDYMDTTYKVKEHIQ